jgi:hypothetical protein
MSRCVLGGRYMMADHKKRIVEEKVDDFDGVSLYPSAMNRLYVLEGIPEVIENPSLEFLLEHLFLDEQTEPNEERFISGFFVEIDITEIGIQRHFPLINNGENYVNELCHMYVDHFTLVDLLEFQKIKCKVLRGYIYTGKRDISVRKVIQNLFELRLMDKKENNPTQELIKLILNSIYWQNNPQTNRQKDQTHSQRGFREVYLPKLQLHR